MTSQGPLPDPIAYARDLPDEELLAYKETFGEQSREWIIAQRELARRSHPSWAKLLWNVAAIAVGIWIIAKLFS